MGDMAMAAGASIAGLVLELESMSQVLTAQQGIAGVNIDGLLANLSNSWCAKAALADIGVTGPGLQQLSSAIASSPFPEQTKATMMNAIIQRSANPGPGPSVNGGGPQTLQDCQFYLKQSHHDLLDDAETSRSRKIDCMADLLSSIGICSASEVTMKSAATVLSLKLWPDGPPTDVAPLELARDLKAHFRAMPIRFPQLPRLKVYPLDPDQLPAGHFAAAFSDERPAKKNLDGYQQRFNMTAVRCSNRMVRTTAPPIRSARTDHLQGDGNAGAVMQPLLQALSPLLGQLCVQLTGGSARRAGSSNGGTSDIIELSDASELAVPLRRPPSIPSRLAVAPLAGNAGSAHAADGAAAHAPPPARLMAPAAGSDGSASATGIATPPAPAPLAAPPPAPAPLAAAPLLALGDGEPRAPEAARVGDTTLQQSKKRVHDIEGMHADVLKKAPRNVELFLE